MLTFGLLVKAVLIVGGIWWCKEIFGRLKSDIAELKTRDGVQKLSIIVIWLITAVILFILIGVVISFVGNILTIFK